jgi:RNA polymerase sigma-70 factor (ECF subfamily)
MLAALGGGRRATSGGLSATDGDDALMAWLAGGGAAGEAAFGELVRRHGAGLARHLRGVTGDEALAEDLLQEALLRVYQARERWTPGQASLRTWLHRVAHNLAIDALRRRKHRGVDALEAAAEELDPGPGPEERLLGRLRGEDVRAALGELPPRDREVVALRFEEDLSHAEIAAIVGGSEGAVKQRVWRALQRLEGRLRAWDVERGGAS